MKIKELELYTSNLEVQTAFYSKTLELKIVEKTEKSVAFQIGTSILKLTYRETVTPYHYAINIPANQEKEALEWLKNRLEVLKDGDSEIQYFDFWDANAIYFYDKDNNIGEFIARKKLKNDTDKAFDKNSLLEISEIGLPTTDIQREYDILNKAMGIPIHSGSFDRFCSIGDENGLFIIINKDLKKDWYPTKDAPYSSNFSIQLEEKGCDYKFEYKKELSVKLFKKDRASIYGGFHLYVLK
mgnify:CR=1 FL=1